MSLQEVSSSLHTQRGEGLAVEVEVAVCAWDDRLNPSGRVSLPNVKLLKLVERDGCFGWIEGVFVDFEAGPSELVLQTWWTCDKNILDLGMLFLEEERSEVAASESLGRVDFLIEASLHLVDEAFLR